jgi:hypothetical protein
MTNQEMVKALEKRFPTLNIKEGSSFSPDYASDNFIWLPNASSVPYTEKDASPLSALDNWLSPSQHAKYDIDVYMKFNDWCKKKGWYASTESYTMMLIKI